MPSSPTTVIVTDTRHGVTVNEDTVTVTVQPQTTSVSVSSAVAQGASNIPFSGTGTVASAGNIADAIQIVADQSFRGTTAPTAGTTNLEEGDLFYDTDDDQLMVYRETSPSNFEFVPLASATGTMDNLDGGGF